MGYPQVDIFIRIRNASRLEKVSKRGNDGSRTAATPLSRQKYHQTTGAATTTYRTMSGGKKNVESVGSSLCGGRKFRKISLTKYTSTARTDTTFRSTERMSERFHQRTQYETNKAIARGIARNIASWNAKPVTVNPVSSSHAFP